ncbi:MAG TPA: hypothetical protein VNU68_35240 [Verrucomicrobiae bacterium]|nr:hypothetical protein [Verrucomicrobiae bacterium]
MSIKTFLDTTFEYDAPAGDPGFVELRIHFDFTPGTPETGRGYLADPARYDPGSGHEVDYDYAEREHTDPGGNKHWIRIQQGEWLDEFCQHWLSTRDADDFNECIPERDPDYGRD